MTNLLFSLLQATPFEQTWRCRSTIHLLLNESVQLRQGRHSSIIHHSRFDDSKRSGHCISTIISPLFIHLWLYVIDKVFRAGWDQCSQAFVYCTTACVASSRPVLSVCTLDELLCEVFPLERWTSKANGTDERIGSLSHLHSGNNQYRKQHAFNFFILWGSRKCHAARFSVSCSRKYLQLDRGSISSPSRIWTAMLRISPNYRLSAADSSNTNWTCETIKQETSRRSLLSIDQAVIARNWELVGKTSDEHNSRHRKINNENQKKTLFLIFLGRGYESSLSISLFYDFLFHSRWRRDAELSAQREGRRAKSICQESCPGLFGTKIRGRGAEVWTAKAVNFCGGMGGGLAGR
jgi:hypothetical protein